MVTPVRAKLICDNILLPIISWDAFHNYLSAETLKAPGAAKWNINDICINKSLIFRCNEDPSCTSVH